MHIAGHGTELDTLISNVTERDMLIIISLSGDNEDAVTLARILKGLKVPMVGLTKTNNCLLSKYCDEMITFKYYTFQLGMTDRLYGSTAQFFLVADFLFLKYLEYLNESK